MEVKQGYKQTEVGLIPEDWVVVTATDACEFVVDCKNRTPPVVNDGDYAIVRTPNVRNGKFVIEDLRFTDHDSYREWTARATPQYGDILITREAPLGEVCAVPRDFKVCLGQRMMLYRPSPSRIDSRFFLYSLMSPQVKSNLFKKIGGSTVGHAKVDDIRFLKLPLPQISEQEAIAEALCDADALIESLEQLIEKKRLIKQGVMQELLTGKKRLPGYSGEWEVKKLGEICDISIGRTPLRLNSALWGQGYTWLSIADLRNKIVIDSKEEITEIAAAEMQIIPKGTLLMSFKLSIGRLCFAGCDLFTNEAICSFNKPQVEADFLYYTLGRTDFSLYGKLAVKGYTLNKESLKFVEVRCPLQNEQTAIATVLSDIDAEIDALAARLEKISQLKQGMMHNLLTGKIRLV